MPVKDRKYVLIIGSSNMDLNIYSERFPHPGETVTGGTFTQSLGGKGANQSVASIRAGSPTIFIGKIGTDAFGDQMLQKLTKEGIDMSYVIRDKTVHSGVAFILINKDGENMISVAPGANFMLNPSEIEKYAEVIKNATALIVQMEIPTPTIEKIFDIASQGNAMKILNPAPLKQLPKSLFSKINIIIPNEGELFNLHILLGFSKIYEKDNTAVLKASKNITSLGVDYVITTLGPKGCFIYDNVSKINHHLPALNVRAVDTVGAGDCFNGVLASQICQGKEVVEAAKYATVAASIAVTKKGAQDSMPSLDKIKLKMSKYNENLIQAK